MTQLLSRSIEQLLKDMRQQTYRFELLLCASRQQFDKNKQVLHLPEQPSMDCRMSLEIASRALTMLKHRRAKTGRARRSRIVVFFLSRRLPFSPSSSNSPFSVLPSPSTISLPPPFFRSWIEAWWSRQGAAKSGQEEHY
jgi:hypothetical protein